MVRQKKTKTSKGHMGGEVEMQQGREMRGALKRGKTF